MECSASGPSVFSTSAPSSIESSDPKGLLCSKPRIKPQEFTSNFRSKESIGNGGNLKDDSECLANNTMQHPPRSRRMSYPFSVRSATARPQAARRASSPPALSLPPAQPSTSWQPALLQSSSETPSPTQTASPPAVQSLVPAQSSANAQSFSSLLMESSVDLGTLKAIEKCAMIKDGADECPDDLACEEEQTKIELLQMGNLKAFRQGSIDNDDIVTSAWYVIEQAKKRPTFKQTWKELYMQSHLGFPIALTNMMWFARYMVSTAFLHKLGGLELATGTLALTYANVTGWLVLVGLASGMEGFCSQAHGAASHLVLEVTLKRSFMVLLLATIPIAGIWCKAEDLFLRMGQTPVLAKAAQSYLYYLLPDLIATSFIAPLRIVLRSQCITKPVLICSVLALCLHVPLNHLFVSQYGMRAIGTAIAICATDFTFALMVGTYVLCMRPKQAINSPTTSAPVALTWGSLLKLAVPSCLMMCMEGWYYEILMLLTGFLPQAREAAETVATVLNGDTLLYALEVALASSVCSRVGNELGAKRPVRAYHATMVALWLSMALGFGAAGWLLLSSRLAWGSFFTKDVKVLESVAQLLPVMSFMKVVTVPQNVACGVLRGSARPAIGLLINLCSFYLVGIPLSILLAFKYGMGVLGLWIGLATAAGTTAILTVAVVLRTNWVFQTLQAYKRTKQKTAPVPYIDNILNEQLYNDMSAKLNKIMPHEESFLMNDLWMEEENGHTEVTADVCSKEQSISANFKQPLAHSKEHGGEDSEMLRMESVKKRVERPDDQFADGSWKLLNTCSGIKAYSRNYGSSKNGHIRCDGHCWEVSMSMMNESVRKCGMLARLEDDPVFSKRLNGCTLPPSGGIQKTGCAKLRLCSSERSQYKSGLKPERRKTA